MAIASRATSERGGRIWREDRRGEARGFGGRGGHLNKDGQRIESLGRSGLSASTFARREVGLKPGATARWTYTGIPGRAAPISGGSATVTPDGSFSATDTSQELNGDLNDCSAAELAASVTVTVSDGGFHTESAEVPANFWCPNENAHTFGSGCL